MLEQGKGNSIINSKEKHKNDLWQDPKENFRILLASLIESQKPCMFYKHVSMKCEEI